MNPRSDTGTDFQLDTNMPFVWNSLWRRLPKTVKEKCRKMQNNTKQEILKKLHRQRPFSLQGIPIPTATPSGLALLSGWHWKKPVGRTAGSRPKYDVIPGKHLVKEAAAEADLFLALDCCDEGRGLRQIGSISRCTNDHHSSNTYYGQYNYVGKVHLLLHLKSYTAFWKEITCRLRHGRDAGLYWPSFFHIS